MARVQRGRVGPFEKECGGLLVVTGVCVCTQLAPATCTSSREGGEKEKGKKGNPAFCGQKATLGPHTFLMQSYR